MTKLANNSPEPPPIDVMSPHSRLTRLAARLSFCRWATSMVKRRAEALRFCFTGNGYFCPAERAFFYGVYGYQSPIW
jgi:hypothetical protein